MKILSATRKNDLFFEIKFNLETETYYRDFVLRKGAYITLFGIPIISKKFIYLKIDEPNLVLVQYKIA